MSYRKEATAELLKYVEKILPGSENTALYETLLGDMTDEQFASLMARLDDGSFVLPLIAPNLTQPKPDVSRNIDIARELGHEFFQHLILTDTATGKTYRTPIPYLVIDLPFRRQQQLLKKKIAFADDNRHIDDLTGQPTGVSKGSSMSFPEFQVTYSMGLERTIEEFIKVRGGDTEAYRHYNNSIYRTGAADLDEIRNRGTKVKSTKVLSTILKAMGLDNTL